VGTHRSGSFSCKWYGLYQYLRLYQGIVEYLYQLRLLQYVNQDLVISDFFNDCRFFRVIPGFVAQFGINVSHLNRIGYHVSPLQLSASQKYIQHDTRVTHPQNKNGGRIL
jgi:hypothetical protein